MCKYCNVLRNFDLEADIHVKTNYWEYNNKTNQDMKIDNWIEALTRIPVNYCPECGSKLK